MTNKLNAVRQSICGPTRKPTSRSMSYEGKNEQPMIFEASFYMRTPLSAAQIMDFAATFDGRLDRMTITDANLKSKSGKPDAEKIAQALKAKYLPAHILLFEKGKDGNNNFPRRSLMLARLSAPEDKDGMFSLIAQVPAEDEPVVAADWWRLAAGTGLNAGHAYLMQWPVREINHGMFAALTPDRATQTWTEFDAACQRLMLEPESFHPVLDGKMLRNVLRDNFMPASLAGTVLDVLKAVGRPVDEVVAYGPDRVVWTLPDPESQRLAHDLLSRHGLIWERSWLDLAGYVPTR